MTRPVYIKLDVKLWKDFKKHAKERGVILAVAVAEALRAVMKERAQ